MHNHHMKMTTGHGISLDEAIERYLQWRTELFSVATVKNDKVALNNFKRAVGEGWHLDEITPELGAASLKYVRASQAPSSANQYYTQMMAFWKWLIDEELVPLNFNPFRNQRMLPIHKTEYPRLPKEEFRGFIEASDRPVDRIFCSIGLYLCVRAEEICSMRVRDVNLDSGYVDVTVWKSKDVDTMPIAGDLADDLRLWLTQYPEMVGEPLNPDWRLVPAVETNGRYIKVRPNRHPSRPAEMVKRQAAAYGLDLPRGQGAHFLRRSGSRAWFSDLVDDGVDGALRIVQAHLHHKNTEQTEQYIGITADRARRDKLIHGRRLNTPEPRNNVIPLRIAQ